MRRQIECKCQSCRSRDCILLCHVLPPAHSRSTTAAFALMDVPAHSSSEYALAAAFHLFRFLVRCCMLQTNSVKIVKKRSEKPRGSFYTFLLSRKYYTGNNIAGVLSTGRK
jgi:hypothetical protein